MSFWVSAAIAIGSAGVGYYNNQQVAKKQDNNLAASIRQQTALQGQAGQQTQKLINQVAASNPQSAKTGLLQQFTQALRANQANATTDLNQPGKVDPAYAKAASDAATGISNFGANRANTMASIDAPALQRQQEGADLSRYGSSIGELQQQSAADNFLSQMRLRGIRANPWLSAIQGAGQAYIASGAGRGGGALGGSASGAGYGTGGTMDMGGGLTANMPTW